MASLKELKGRINSVKSTQKITKAKQMVAAAKLRKAQAPPKPRAPMPASGQGHGQPRRQGDRQRQQRPSCCAGTGSSEQVHLLVVVNSDKGLCGGVQLEHRQGSQGQARGLKPQARRWNSTSSAAKGRAPIRRAYPKAISKQFDTTDVREARLAEAEGIATNCWRCSTTASSTSPTCSIRSSSRALAQDPTQQQIIPVPCPAATAASGCRGRIRARRGGNPRRAAAALSQAPSCSARCSKIRHPNRALR
jgi:F-type H+-transporting ATPase subunit gamma